MMLKSKKLTIAMVLLGISGVAQINANEKNCGVISGILLSEAKVPLQGQDMFLVGDSRFLRYGCHEKTDENGQFSFQYVPAGDYILAYGPLINQGRRVTIQPNQNMDVKPILNLDKVQSLAGIVRSGKEGIGNHILRFMLLNPDPARWVWPPRILGAKTNKNGMYQVDAIEPGRYWVSVQPDISSLVSSFSNKEECETISWVSFTQIVEIKSEQRELDLTVPEAALEVNLTSLSGEPVSDSMCFLRSSEIRSPWLPMLMPGIPSMHTGKSFSFRVVPECSYDLVVMDTPRYGLQLMADVQIHNQKETIQWSLEKPMTLKAAIDFSDEVAGYPYVMVMSEHDPKLHSLSDHAFDFGDGNSFYPLSLAFPPGKYKVFAMTKEVGYSTEGVIVNLSENMEIRSELVPEARLKVVLKSNKQKIGGRTIKIWDAKQNELIRLYDPLWSYDLDWLPAVVLPTCKDGMTTIGRLRPGQYGLTIEGTKVKTEVVVKSSETTTVYIDLDGP